MYGVSNKYLGARYSLAKRFGGGSFTGTHQLPAHCLQTHAARTLQFKWTSILGEVVVLVIIITAGIYDECG